MGQYREKECKNCGKKHRRRGPHCSKACSNSYREVSENQRQNMRKVAEEYHKTPEGAANARIMRNNPNSTTEDYAIDIPYFPDIDPDIPTDFQ